VDAEELMALDAVSQRDVKLERGYRFGELSGSRKSHIIDADSKALCGYKGKNAFRPVGYARSYGLVCRLCTVAFETAPAIGDREFRLVARVECYRKSELTILAPNVDAAREEVYRRFAESGEGWEWKHEDKGGWGASRPAVYASESN
jgi:hypothetical protein